jgi:ABC-type nitrate/sulfonate/bicarbonate transport system permease component
MWRHTQVTLIRGFSGFAIALVGGIALGVLMARSRVFEGILEPFLAATYPVPKLALYPIFILWLGLGAASKIALVALECVYPIAYNTYAGVKAVDRSHVWAARNAGAGRIRITFAVMLKSALPSIMAGVRIAMPLMLVVMVVVEKIGESRGLGFLIRFASAQFEPQGALAVILVLAFIGFVFDRLVVLLTRVLAFWARGVQL